MRITTGRECSCGGVSVLRESRITSRDTRGAGFTHWYEAPVFTIAVTSDAICDECKALLKALDEWYAR